MNELTEIFGEVISSYTREMALADGVLVDLTTLYPNDTRIYKYPVACSSSVWGLIERAGGNPGAWVWDLCYMSAKFPTQKLDETSRLFRLTLGRNVHALMIVCGPGDNAEPVMTIMLSEED